RRGLLSQGYMTTMTHTDAVDATKDFQPAPDSHIDVEVHVVCTASDSTNTSVVYVNAVQNGYALKKSDTSASVGLSIFGSLSLPIRTNSDAMVKISSETIQSGSFYDKFFDLVGRYLRTSVHSEPVPHGSVEVTPLPPPISPSAPVAVVTPPAPAVALASRSVAPIIASAPAAAASGTGAQPATAAPNDAHTATPVNANAAAATAAVETTASIQAPALLPGIGEPPMLTAPSNEEVATAAAHAAAPAPASGAAKPVAVAATPASDAAATAAATAPVAQ
ncbi:MAG TPA: DUF2242 domain-containing protein, partial [Paraburkholderia sp.]